MKHPKFAERFRSAVAMAGVNSTQKSLSKLLGVSEVMIWSYRNGEKLPRMSTALRIAEKLDVSVLWLLQGDEEKQHGVREKSAPYQNEKSLNNIISFYKKLSKKEQQQALNLLKQHFPKNK